jgi:hypothetical protein
MVIISFIVQAPAYFALWSVTAEKTFRGTDTRSDEVRGWGGCGGGGGGGEGMRSLFSWTLNFLSSE